MKLLQIITLIAALFGFAAFANAQTLKDGSGYKIGVIESNGTVKSANGSIVGKFDGNTIKSANGSIIGRIDGKNIKNANGSILGLLDGNTVKAANGSIKGKIDNGTINDASGHIIGRYDGVVRIDWLSCWFFFFRF
ncbi:MAG: hypothetical protein LBN93_08555 [Candidatus Symbiothrix sp.]|jgi:hypothetical protein|nr:hypothetical protein [Candidatus Symbiothrix sp.]